MAIITHKILVSKATGKTVPPVHLMDSEMPCPEDCVWKEIVPGTFLYKHFCTEPPEDISNINLDESYFDFNTNQWVEVPSTLVPSIEFVKKVRNELLKASDISLSEETDAERIEQWVTYRAQLRDLFVGKDENFDWSTIVFPRTPSDIAELKRKAAEGDEEAAAIVAKDNL